LQRIQLPTLVLWGERDGIVTTAHGKAYHEGIAQSQFVTLANSGHLPHVEAPETCADMIVEFLRNSGV
jgi:pimeloyl-ACP methyl ester carboxylesterase